MFSLRLKKLREEAGYSQYTFADAFGCAQSTVGSWEAGRREPPFSTLVKIADFFGVTTDYLLGRTDKPEIHVIDNPPDFADVGAAQLTRKGEQPFTPEQVDVIKQLVKEAQEKKS